MLLEIDSKEYSRYSYHPGRYINCDYGNLQLSGTLADASNLSSNWLLNQSWACWEISTSSSLCIYPSKNNELILGLLGHTYRVALNEIDHSIEVLERGMYGTYVNYYITVTPVLNFKDSFSIQAPLLNLNEIDSCLCKIIALLVKRYKGEINNYV